MCDVWLTEKLFDLNEHPKFCQLLIQKLDEHSDYTLRSNPKQHHNYRCSDQEMEQKRVDAEKFAECFRHFADCHRFSLTYFYENGLFE